MANKAKHAFGSRKNLDAAIAAGTVDAYDLLFMVGEDETPAFGWMDKNGNPVVMTPADDLAELESRMTTELADKASSESIAELEVQLAEKVGTAEVDAKVETAVKSKVDAVVSTLDQSYEKSKYEIADVPTGTLVDYRDKEIRIQCPANTVWTKQSVGEGGDANCNYATLKVYAPNDRAVGYIEHLGDQVDSEILTDFSVDEFGHRYQPTWLALARYDETSDTWTYFGNGSAAGKYIGWDYRIDWYDADGVMIASDNVRINLSNEQCHSVIEPYYVSSIMQQVDTKIEEKLVEANTGYEMVEF